MEQASFQKMITAALRPAKVNPNKVEEISSRRHRTLVRVPASQMGQAIGKNESNVRLASRLMKTHIELQKEV